MLFSNRPGNTVYLGPKTMVPRNLPKISRGFTNFFPKIYIIIHHYTRKSVWGGGGGGAALFLPMPMLPKMEKAGCL